jgi:hypothetical protein
VTVVCERTSTLCKSPVLLITSRAVLDLASSMERIACKFSGSIIWFLSTSFQSANQTICWCLLCLLSVVSASFTAPEASGTTAPHQHGVRADANRPQVSQLHFTYKRVDLPGQWQPTATRLKSVVDWCSIMRLAGTPWIRGFNKKNTATDCRKLRTLRSPRHAKHHMWCFAGAHQLGPRLALRSVHGPSQSSLLWTQGYAM